MSAQINNKLDALQADYKEYLDHQAMANADLLKKLDELIKKLNETTNKKPKAETETTATAEATPAKGFANNSMNWFQREFAKDKNVVNKYLSDDLKKDYQQRINDDETMKELAGTKRSAAECKLFWNTYCKAGVSTRSAVVVDAIKKDYEVAKAAHSI